MITRHFSDAAILSTLPVEGQATNDAAQLDEFASLTVEFEEEPVLLEEEGQVGIQEESQTGGLTPKTKAVKSLKDAAVRLHHHGQADPDLFASDSLTRAVRRAALVRPVATKVDGSFDPETLTMMELAMLLPRKPNQPSKELLEKYANIFSVPSDYISAQACAKALAQMNVSGGASSPIQKVFADVCALDERPALSVIAEDALHATGEGVAPNTKLHSLCNNNPAHCVTVVQKAHQVREHLKKKLASSYPNMDKYQERLLHQTVQPAVEKLAVEVPLDVETEATSAWFSKQNSGFPADWIAHQVVEAQGETLRTMTDVEKQAELKGHDESKPLMAQV